jgi:hypothetical protein
MHQELVQKYNGFVDAFKKEGKLTGSAEFWESHSYKEMTKLLGLVSDVADGQLVSFFDYVLDDAPQTNLDAQNDLGLELGEGQWTTDAMDVDGLDVISEEQKLAGYNPGFNKMLIARHN